MMIKYDDVVDDGVDDGVIDYQNANKDYNDSKIWNNCGVYIKNESIKKHHF